MADNLGYTPGAGATVATDEIGGLHFQRLKLTHGVEGVAVDASEVNPIPVTDQTAAALQALNDTMLYMLAAILEKMPRVTGNDQAAVSIEAGSVGVSSLPTLATVTTVGTVTTMNNQNQMGGKPAYQAYDSITNMGALHLYQNIIVS